MSSHEKPEKIKRAQKIGDKKTLRESGSWGGKVAAENNLIRKEIVELDKKIDENEAHLNAVNSNVLISPEGDVIPFETDLNLEIQELEEHQKELERKKLSKSSDLFRN